MALGALSATVRGPLLVGLPVAAALALVGVAPWKHQRPLVEQLGALAAYALTPKVWSARLDLLTSAAKKPQLPPQMAGLVLHEMTDAKGREVCLIEDQKVGHLSVAVRVVGRRFALASNEEQDAMLGEWAAALDPLRAPGRPGGRGRLDVVGLADAHRGPPGLDGRGHRPARPARGAPGLRRGAGRHRGPCLLPRRGGHPDRRRGPRRPWSRASATGRAKGRRVVPRPGRPCCANWRFSPSAWPARVSTPRPRSAGRSWPGWCANGSTRAASAGSTSGAAVWAISPVWWPRPTPARCTANSAARSWRTDATLHRALVVSEWPRTPVGADWMGSFLLDVDCVRLVTVIFEPLDPVSSTRQVEFAMANHEGDLSHRDEKRRVITGQARRRGHNIARREEQLLDGHIEFRYLGLVVVSAPDDEALDRATEAVTEAGARCRMELRPVDGQHAAAVVAALPLGRRPRRASA